MTRQKGMLAYTNKGWFGPLSRCRCDNHNRLQRAMTKQNGERLMVYIRPGSRLSVISICAGTLLIVFGGLSQELFGVEPEGLLSRLLFGGGFAGLTVFVVICIRTTVSSWADGIKKGKFLYRTKKAVFFVWLLALCTWHFLILTFEVVLLIFTGSVVLSALLIW